MYVFILHVLHIDCFDFSCPLYSCEVVDTNVMLTGDEDGHIKMWDMRRYAEILISLFLVIAEHQWDKYNPLFSLVYLVIGKVLHSNY